MLFEYGLDGRYGAATAADNIANAPGNLPFSASLTSLLPWMTYHCRAVATNCVGRTAGPDVTFTLPPPQMGGPSLLSVPGNVTLPQGGSTSVGFSVWDPDTDLDQVIVRVRCNNESPAAGDRYWRLRQHAQPHARARRRTIPAPTAITVSVSDGTPRPTPPFNADGDPVGRVRGSLLYLTNAQVVSTQAWRFRRGGRRDRSPPITRVEYRSDLSPTNAWMPATNVTTLRGGVFEVAIGPPQPRLGFYRAKGFRLLTGRL